MDSTLTLMRHILDPFSLTAGVWNSGLFLYTLNATDWAALPHLIESDFQIEALNLTNFNEKGYTGFRKCF